MRTRSCELCACCGKWRIALGFACRMATCKWEEMPNKHPNVLLLHLWNLGCCHQMSFTVSGLQYIYLYGYIYIYHTLIRVWYKWEGHVGRPSDFFMGVPDFARMRKIRIKMEYSIRMFHSWFFFLQSPKFQKKNLHFIFWPHLDSDFSLVAYFFNQYIFTI